MRKTLEVHSIEECLEPFYREICEEIDRKASWIKNPGVKAATVGMTIGRIRKDLRKLSTMPEKERSNLIAGAIKKNRLQVLRNRKTHNRYIVYLAEPRTLEFLAPSVSVPDASGMLEARDTLEKALPKLTELERKVLVLAFDEGLTRTEIAALLRTSISNVSRTIGRARRKCEDFLTRVHI